MRLTLTPLVALGLAVVAQAYPVVSSDPNNVALNVWNTGLTQAKAKAKALNRPTLMVMLDSVNCGSSKSWLSKIADSQEWQSFLAANPLVLVMADKPYMALSTWSTYTRPFRDATGMLYFPTVVLFRPDGTVADEFLARSTLGSNPGFYNRVRNTTAQYPNTGMPPGTPAPGTIGFGQPSLTVSESAGSVTVTVTRQGGSAGAQTFSYATEDGTALEGVNYIGTEGNLAWGDGKATASPITVYLVNDNQWASPAARTFTLRLTRTLGTATLGTSLLTVTINEASPPPGSTTPIFAGSYQGFFYEPVEQTVRGTLKLSASASGALKAQAVLDSKAYTFEGTGQTEFPYTAELQSKYSDDVLSIQVDELGIVNGHLGDADLFGRRNDLSGMTAFAGYYTALLVAAETTANSDEIDNRPDGSGYVTFTVGSRGSVSYKGALADGTLFSGASTLVTYSGAELAELGYTDVADNQNYACFALYNPIYSRRGVIAAQIWLDGNHSTTYEDNKVFLVGTQWVYPGKSATATDDGFSTTLEDGFFTEVGAAFFKPENLASVFDGASLETECGTVPVQASGRSIKLPPGNALKATLTASTTSGLFSGRFLYSPVAGASPYTVKFSGVVVPALGIGAGYYLAPDHSVPGYSFKRSKLLVIAP